VAVTFDLPDPAEKARVVEAMFDRIAPRYDLLNRLLTFRIDQSWRRTTIRLAGVGPGDVVVDLGCGTGDMCDLAAATGARVVGVDFAAGMLAAAIRRGTPGTFVRADAARLPLGTGSATVVTSAFAVRNFVSLDLVLGEAARVLALGGRIALLEVDEPRNRFTRWGHALYFGKVVPIIGGLLSDRWAYSYLPRSAVYLPTEAEFVRRVESAGFSPVTKHRLSGGVAQLIIGVRSSASPFGKGGLRGI
jgi:demethylmenaquinone methyltransferase / 2-methoxy-6-polyprenyl-1,4-benzoquinol methylase